MQAKGQDIRAVIELLRFPSIVIGVRKDLAGKIKSAADFKGLKIGVTAPGSSTFITAQHAMVKAGLKPNDASFIGIGGGASGVAAMKKGEIDAISHLDPVIAKLEADGDIVTLIDTRTEAGTRALFGGSNPAACVYLKNDFIAANPNTVQAVVNAHYKALLWIAAATPTQVADAVPAEFHLGDRALYEAAFAKTREAYSRTGISAVDGMKSVLDMLKALDKEMETASVKVEDTFVGRFAEKAAGGREARLRTRISRGRRSSTVSGASPRFRRAAPGGPSRTGRRPASRRIRPRARRAGRARRPIPR